VSVLLDKLVQRLSRLFRAARPTGSDIAQAAAQTGLEPAPDCFQSVVATLPGAMTLPDLNVSDDAQAIADAEAVDAAMRAIRAAIDSDVGAFAIAEPVLLAGADAGSANETVAAPMTTFRFAMRMRPVAKLPVRKKGRAAKAKPVGKARVNLKPKPVVVAKTVKKRGPDLFATKVKRPVAKRPTTKIFIETRPKRTAEILAFPVRKPLSFAPRLKRAA